MNTSAIQNPLRNLPTNVGQLIPLDNLQAIPGSPDGGFADLLRNFDAEPTPDPQASRPTNNTPEQAPAPPPAVNQQRPPMTAVRQAEGADAKADAAGRLDTDPGPDGPTEQGPVHVTGELSGEPACTLQETRDPEANTKGADPTKTSRLRRTPEAEKAKATAAEADAKGPADASAAAAGQLQAQQVRTPADKSTDIRQPSTDLPPTKTVAEALARATDHAQGQQQAERQAQVQATQAAPLDAPTAAVQNFSAELKNSLPAPLPSRTTTPGLGLTSLGSLGASNISGSSEEAPVVPTAVNMPEALDDVGFAGALGARLAMLAKDGVQKAELHLNPADMGPVAVQITVDGQQAQVTFHAAQADTRGVLEQGLPDLAAALAANGLTLSGGGVFQQQQGRQGAQEGFASSGERGVGGMQAVDAGSALPQGMPVGTRQRGVVDLYA